MKLIEKENDIGEGKSFYAYSDNGKKYSVINIQKIMETAPYFTPEQKDEWFNEWEAIELNGEELLFDTTIRAKTWEELEKLLQKAEARAERKAIWIARATSHIDTEEIRLEASKLFEEKNPI